MINIEEDTRCQTKKKLKLQINKYAQIIFQRIKTRKYYRFEKFFALFFKIIRKGKSNKKKHVKKQIDIFTKKKKTKFKIPIKFIFEIK